MLIDENSELLFDYHQAIYDFIVKLVSSDGEAILFEYSITP